MRIALGGDHAGFDYKTELLKFLEEQKHSTKDFGPFNADSVDYPDFVHPVATAVEQGEFDFGILICGSANGVSMTANKHKGIRAAICWTEEIASLARKHNDANILSIAVRFVSDDSAKFAIELFLKTEFSGAERHVRRIGKF